jgi:hypothetical protein
MPKPVVTLSPLEADAFPRSQVELDQILTEAETTFNLALEEFTEVKNRLFDENGEDLDKWPESDKKFYYSQIAKIDAITDESTDYIKRLTAEVTQILN